MQVAYRTRSESASAWPGPFEQTYQSQRRSGVETVPQCDGAQAIMIDDQRHSTTEPEICGGQTVVTGTRVTLRTVLATLAEGASIEEVLVELPTLSAEAVRAVIAFAAAAAEDDLPVPAMPSVP